MTTPPPATPKTAGAETANPAAALAAKSIAQRAAGARDLARFGTPADIPLLLEKAAADTSAAVRLGCAGAAADILSRYRLGPAAASLSAEDRAALFERMKGIDPGVNSGLFSLLATVGHPSAAARIRSGLRDPRGDVRVGAAVGLTRLVSSAAALGDLALEADVVGLFDDKRLPPDARAELARVCAAAGYTRALPAIEALELGGNLGEIAHAAAAALRRAADPAASVGAWSADGRDAGEVSEVPGATAALLLRLPDGRCLWSEAGGPLLPREELGPWRLLHLRRAGETTPGPALQASGLTFHPAEETEIISALDRCLDTEHLEWAQPGDRQCQWAHQWREIEALLPASGPGLRTRALLHRLRGDVESALADLIAATEAKRPPLDAFLFLGDHHALYGDPPAAREAWEQVVRRARKKRDPVLIAAQSRLGQEPAAEPV